MNSILTQTANWAGVTLVISGGQTGADQGGLMAAFKCGIQTGGTAPSEFYTDNGPNPLLELLGLVAEGDYRSRTIKNVKNSDGTVLLSMTLESPGSRLTRNQAKCQGKPFIEFDLSPILALKTGDNLMEYTKALSATSLSIAAWMAEHNIGVLNVAGNREKSKDFSTTRLVERILMDTFATLEVEGLVHKKEA